MPGPAFLSGGQVSLRAVEEEDLPFVRDAVNDPNVWKSVGGQVTPTNLVMERKFFEEMCRSDDVVQFLVTADEERVGLVELDPIEWDRGRAEIAFWIAPAHQGEGYGRDALATVAAYAFEHLGLHKLSAEAFSFNDDSIGLLGSVGFQREGLFREEEWIDGEWVDVVRFGLLAADWTPG